ncbi:phosphopantothenoylcysteine decarboxylase [bacterium]|nr:phosphopantothenoylcysteine decarboxylase [bacterium]
MKILITAGPTREYLDPVRFISNPSTGKMGYLISEKAIKRGHKVILISGPTYLKPPDGIKIIKTISGNEMKEAVLKYFPEYDVLIMTAAVSDWKPEKKYRGKLKRKKEWNLKLIPNPDILKEVSKIKKENQIVIGFALETENIEKNALKKLKEKKLDLIIGNTTEFFGEGKPSKVVFISKDGKVKKYKRIKKEKIAEKIVNWIENETH